MATSCPCERSTPNGSPRAQPTCEDPNAKPLWISPTEYICVPLTRPSLLVVKS